MKTDQILPECSPPPESDFSKLGRYFMVVSIVLLLISGVLAFAAKKAWAIPDDATTITVAEFSAEIRAILNDPDRFWTDDELLRWINSGRRELATYAGCFQRSTEIALAANQAFYDMPAGTIQILWVWHLTYVQFEESPAFGLKRANPLTIGNKLTTSSGPEFFIELPGQVAIVNAISTPNGDKIRVISTYKPDLLTSTADELAMPEITLDALKAYVLHYAFAKDKQNARSGVYRQIFNTEISVLREIFIGQPLANQEIVTR